RDHRGAVPGLLTARVRQQLPHLGPARPGPGARPAGQDRRKRRWPRPARRAVPASSGPMPTGRPPSAPADAGTAPARRTLPAPPPPPAPPPRRRSRAAQPPATQAPDRRTDRPPPAAPAAGSALATPP